MRKKKILKISITVIVVLLVAILGVSNYLFEYAITRKGDGGNRQVKVANKVDLKKDSIPYQIQMTKEEYQEEARIYFKSNKPKEDIVRTKDGLHLKIYSLTYPNSKKWALLIHGYRSNHKKMYEYAYIYSKNGYNVVIPDLRASGTSEGKYLGMGILDKDDMKEVLKWIKKQNEQAEIVVQGNSMGATTALLLAGEKEAEQVKAFVADAGYTSAYDIFKSELQLRFHLPSFPFLDIANVICRLRAGYSFNEISALKAVAKANKPILFIHGKKDRFVPFEMMEKLYQAKKVGKKEKLVADNAAHVESLFELGEEYEKKIMDFIK